MKTVNNLLEGGLISKDVIDHIFDLLEKQLLDQNEITIDLRNVTFVSVYFLEKLEDFIGSSKLKNCDSKIKITNVPPAIYKVFQVSRIRSILNITECS